MNKKAEFLLDSSFTVRTIIIFIIMVILGCILTKVNISVFMKVVTMIATLGVLSLWYFMIG